MPPKSKFTKEEIINAALQIAEEEGLDAITARALGEKLGSSARPIFTVFKNMEELTAEVIKAAKKIYKSYVERGLKYDNAFKGVGTEYIMFAVQRPKLFQILFMSEVTNQNDINSILPKIEDNYSKILYSITDNYGIDKENAIKIYRHMWIYTHGIASLIATKTCSFTAEELSTMLDDVCRGLLIKLKIENDQKENRNDNT